PACDIGTAGYPCNATPALGVLASQASIERQGEKLLRSAQREFAMPALDNRALEIPDDHPSAPTHLDLDAPLRLPAVDGTVLPGQVLGDQPPEIAFAWLKVAGVLPAVGT